MATIKVTKGWLEQYFGIKIDKPEQYSSYWQTDGGTASPEFDKLNEGEYVILHQDSLKTYWGKYVHPAVRESSRPTHPSETGIGALVKQLREIAKTHENFTMMLPIEIVSIIEGKTQEQKFEMVNVGKVLQYVADMMEE